MSPQERLRSILAHQQPVMAFSERVERLVKELSLEEKISLLAGKNFWETVPIPRLDIPSLKVSDGPNGARGGLFFGGTTAACFPASVALAAGFDEDVAVEIGKALAQETMTKGAKVILAPTVCPHRSPLGGRNFESFSEDPFLAGRLASKYISGVQSEGVGATIKHFAGNEQETRRFTMNANISDRALREIYMKPFEIAIKEAKPWAVMTSYNLVNGTHADMNEFLLQKVLRQEWGWDGLVMSDWGGTNSVAESITAGLDLEMPGPAERRKIEAVSAAVKEGKLAESAIDKSARAVLRLLEMTGKFEHPETPDEKAVDLPEHRALIRKAGGRGIVLLKNEGNILPLEKDKLKSIAALGAAKESLIHGGGSASVNCHYRTTPWEAMKTVLGGSFDLRYAQGAHTFRNLPDWKDNLVDTEGKPGFTVSCFDTSDLNGKPFSVSNAASANYMPLTGVSMASATLCSTYTPEVSGSHYLSFGGLGISKLLINDKVVLEQKQNCPDSMAFLLGGAKELETQYTFEKGESYSIRVESWAPTGDNKDGLTLLNGLLATRLGFLQQQEYERDLIADAVAAAKDADVAICFVGNTTAWETEGQDMTTMSLPAHGSQDRLIEAVCAVNSNVIVVNSTGVAIAMPWLSKIKGFVQAWFGGQEAGNSIADVLFGTVNPSGKLPVTFPKRYEDTPAYKNFPGDIEKLQVNYEEGIYIGYRHYDKAPETIQFPFGFGLSYTTFSISDLAVNEKTLAANGSVTIRATVKNTGSKSGAEVVQVYLTSPAKDVDVPLKQLAGYKKVDLEAGESKAVEVEVGYQSASYWSEKSQKWVVEAGEYKVLVGSSSRDVTEAGAFSVAEKFTFAA